MQIITDYEYMLSTYIINAVLHLIKINNLGLHLLFKIGKLKGDQTNW